MFFVLLHWIFRHSNNQGRISKAFRKKKPEDCTSRNRIFGLPESAKKCTTRLFFILGQIFGTYLMIFQSFTAPTARSTLKNNQIWQKLEKRLVPTYWTLSEYLGQAWHLLAKLAHDINLHSIRSYNRYWLRDDLALKPISPRGVSKIRNPGFGYPIHHNIDSIGLHRNLAIWISQIFFTTCTLCTIFTILLTFM